MAPDTLTINLFGGSTAAAAARLYADLDALRIPAELVRAAPPDALGLADAPALGRRLSLVAACYQRQRRVAGTVRVAVTDSPLPAGSVRDPCTADAGDPWLDACVRTLFGEFWNLNILLVPRHSGPGAHGSVGPGAHGSLGPAGEPAIAELLAAWDIPHRVVPLDAATPGCLLRMATNALRGVPFSELC